MILAESEGTSLENLLKLKYRDLSHAIKQILLYIFISNRIWTYIFLRVFKPFLLLTPDSFFALNEEMLHDQRCLTEITLISI